MRKCEKTEFCSLLYTLVGLQPLISRAHFIILKLLVRDKLTFAEFHCNMYPTIFEHVWVKVWF